MNNTVESLLAEIEAVTEVDEVFDIADRLELDVDGDDFSSLKIQVKQHLLQLLSDTDQTTYLEEVKKVNAVSVDDNEARNTLSKLYASIKALAEKFDKSFAGGSNYPCKEYVEDMQSDYSLLLEEFKYPILVTGETSAGKSSLLNYLLGVDLLSVHTLSCTNRICEITYGEEPKIKLVNAYDGKVFYTESWTADNKDIAIKEIQSLISERETLQGSNSNHEMKSSEDAPYSLVRIYWPSEFLESGILVVDSPGIGEKKEVPHALRSYIFRAVAYIIVVNSANAGGIQAARLQKLLQQISGVLRNDGYLNFNPSMALFICNKWDTVAVPERELVKTDSITKLKRCWPELLMARAANNNALVPPEVVQLFEMLRDLIPISRKQKLSKSYSFMAAFVEGVQETCRCYLLRAKSMESELKEDKSRLKLLETTTQKCMKELVTEKNALINALIAKYRKFVESLNNESIVSWSENDLLDEEFDEDNLMKLQEHAVLKVRQRLNNHLELVAQEIHEDLQIAKDLLLEKFTTRLDEIFDQTQSKLVESADIENDTQTNDFYLDPRTGYSKFSELYGLYDVWTNMTAARRAAFILTSPVWVAPAFIASPIYYITKLVKTRNQQEEIQKFKQNKPEEMKAITLLILDHIGSENFARKFVVEKFDSLATSLLNSVKSTILKSLQSRIDTIKTALKDKRCPKEINKLYKPLKEDARKLLINLNNFYLQELSESSIKFKDLQGFNEESTPLSLGLKVKLYRATLHKNDEEKNVIIQVPVDKSMRDMHEFVSNCQIISTLESQNVLKFLSICYTPPPTITAIGIFENCNSTLRDLILYNETIVSESDSDTIRFRKIYSMVNQIIQGIVYLHAKELIHAHLTTENVLVSLDKDQHKLKLCHATKQCTLYEDIDFEESIIPYLAPEVLKSYYYKEASDVYSFAILFWEVWYWKLVTNLFDWNTNTCHSQKISDLFKMHKLTPKPHRNVDGICLDSLAINPNERPDIISWHDILEDITKNLQ
ncbi:uncharacterized protein TRIADDRAFT_54954 [Trichoplax adhaerens]|uniref:Protein kinase domain-containing protein n=1 Tax=Trichoplax adhaerens TaxID=10228 RepID=B3RTG2_TRIAD|nr:hypothetical protein TRIADDRAFT_54954 [Trichoplax adhaerens]EDV26689.1 hypothetical protein TRIADDRAFT_54954 [Trichoplax adhaerens]|eukprot:XP_002110685.1 hypothetical protein TRIADDRAFT_54954 [Trichoplax adhaerens]